ncbi:hypothetical protein HIMB114_00003490 [alpha proteobacterium HIMB114]|nr:hypothetical protein HIMB114_00003490 [alpha proteobacterium HIMB114]
MKNNTLDLEKYLWKKRLILINKNHSKIKEIQDEIKNNKTKLSSYKIESIFIRNEFKSPITLIGLDGLIKLEEEDLNLNKIFKLISTMPMANF